MSDAPVSAPSAPSAAPAATAAPVHHANLQPREQGKFAGPPDATKAPAVPAAGAPAPSQPEAPKTWKVGGKEFKSADDLYAYAAEKDAEARALDEYRRREAEAAKRARELEERTKDPRKALTPELEQEILARHVREWQEAEAFKAMTPQEQQLYLLRKQVEKERNALEAEKAERKRLEDEERTAKETEERQRAESAAREELKETITHALNAAGLPLTTSNVQATVMVLRGAAERGVVYPPEVVARKVKEAKAAERREYVKGLSPSSVLSELPELIEHLNAVDDAALLRKLGPLGEKLRRLNLESLGATPAATPAPVSTGAASVGAPVDLPPGDPRWADVFKQRAKGR